MLLRIWLSRLHCVPSTLTLLSLAFGLQGKESSAEEEPSGTARARGKGGAVGSFQGLGATHLSFLL